MLLKSEKVLGSISTLRMILTNKSGAPTQAGYVYRLSTNNDNSFVFASEDDDAQVVVAPGVIANNASGEMILTGHTDVYLDGVTGVAINVGIKYLYFSSTNGQAKVSSQRGDGCFGEGTERSSGAGLAKAYVFPRERIREWGWSDEQSWEKHFILPVSETAGANGLTKDSAHNPIIARGGSGAWDESSVYTPCPVLVNNVLNVYYTGFDMSSPKLSKIGVATAPASAIEGAYAKHGSNPLLTGDVAWEQASGVSKLHGVAVLYDANAPNTGTDYKWKMWYGGASGSASSAIGYAYSADGINWTKLAGNPVMAHSFGDGIHNWPSLDVMMIGEMFFMFYRNSAGNLSWACSYDGINWTNIGTALTVGAGGEWDDVIIGFPHIFHSQGNLYITYQGISEVDNSVRQVGLALATIRDVLSGTINIAKYLRNPTLDKSNPGTESWDNGITNEAAILQYKETFYFHYAAAADATPNNRDIGLAYIKK